MSTRKIRRKYRPSSHANSISGKSALLRRPIRRREIDHSRVWYVVKTSPSLERHILLCALATKGFDVFWPADNLWRLHKLRCSDASVGWYGPYMFVGFDNDSRFDHLWQTYGVQSILMSSGKPATVRPEFLQAVADEMSGYRKTPQAPFMKGQDVLIQAGPFAELAGIVEQADAQSGRASVAVEMFGKRHIQELDFVDLKAA